MSLFMYVCGCMETLDPLGERCVIINHSSASQPVLGCPLSTLQFTAPNTCSVGVCVCEMVRNGCCHSHLQTQDGCLNRLHRVCHSLPPLTIEPRYIQDVKGLNTHPESVSLSPFRCEGGRLQRDQSSGEVYQTRCYSTGLHR